MFSKFITNYVEQGWWHSSFSVKMHALAAQGSEQKRKACINFTQMNLFSKWYCKGSTLPHNWNLWTSYVIILVQCNFSWFSKYCYSCSLPTINPPNLYATWPEHCENRLEFPYNKGVWNNQKHFSISKTKLTCSPPQLLLLSHLARFFPHLHSFFWLWSGLWR